MRNGVKVYDCDTRLRPTIETIIPFLDREAREQAPQFENLANDVEVVFLRFFVDHALKRSSCSSASLGPTRGQVPV